MSRPAVRIPHRYGRRGPLAAAALVLCAHTHANADTPGPPVAAFDPASAPAELPLVFADGTGLPAGRGSARRGATLFEQWCRRCHGPGGVGLSAPSLAGAEVALDDEPVPVEQPPVQDDHHEQEVAACAGTAGNAMAAAATEAKITFFITFPPLRRLQN